MSEHLSNLTIDVAAAFVLPIICFLLGVAWSKLIGGWRDNKSRKWWTTFCLVMPFLFLAMLTKIMAESDFESLRAIWSIHPILLLLLLGLTTTLSAILVVAIVRLWRTPRSS